MTNSVYKIHLDIHNYDSHVFLKAKKGDTSSFLYITLMDGKNHYEITPECYAVLTGKKEDGNILYNKCTFFENMIVYEFTPQTTSTVGRVSCEIKLYGAGDALLTSAAFTILVMDTVYNEEDEVGSEKEVTALTALVSEATTLINTVEYKLASGAFVGEKGEKGDKGDRGPQGVSYVATAIPTGYFAIEMDSATGDLYCVAEEGAKAPAFYMDGNGNLYYEIQEG